MEVEVVSSTGPESENVRTLKSLIQSWDVTSAAVIQTDDEIFRKVLKINILDVLGYIDKLSGAKWSIRHTKSLCFCLQKGSTDMTEWLKPAVDKFRECPQFRKHFVAVLHKVLKSSEIPELSDEERYEFDKTDFTSCAENSACTLQFCLTLFQLLKDCDNCWMVRNIIKSLGAYVVVLISTNDEPAPWTSDGSIQASANLKGFLLDLHGCKEMAGLLTGRLDGEAAMDPDDTATNTSLFQHTLVYLRPRISKDKWKRNPSYMKCFVVCLFHVRLPHLGGYLDSVLPASLTLVDDHRTENKVLGIQCLSHLIQNTSRTELQWQGRADVIYEAVKLQLYSKEAALLELAIPCMLAILGVVEPSSKLPGAAVYDDTHLQPRKWDQIFRMLLFNAEMESLISIRRIYSRHLSLFISRMGVTVVKHTRRLLRLVTAYLETYDGPQETTRFNTLTILNNFIREAWPRIPSHVPAILKSLLRLIYDVSVDVSLTPASVKQQLIDEAKQSLILLRTAAHTQVNACLSSMLEIDLTPECVAVMKEVLTAS